MSDEHQQPITIQHRVRRMAGRDPDEQHRVATPLELLFDLTFVIAFGLSANELAHQLAENHIAAGLGAFLFATFVLAALMLLPVFAASYALQGGFEPTAETVSPLRYVGVVSSAAPLHFVDDQLLDELLAG